MRYKKHNAMFMKQPHLSSLGFKHDVQSVNSQWKIANMIITQAIVVRGQTVNLLSYVNDRQTNHPLPPLPPLPPPPRCFVTFLTEDLHNCLTTFRNSSFANASCLSATLYNM